jgi:hypothetical protein
MKQMTERRISGNRPHFISSLRHSGPYSPVTGRISPR